MQKSIVQNRYPYGCPCIRCKGQEQCSSDYSFSHGYYNPITCQNTDKFGKWLIVKESEEKRNRISQDFTLSPKKSWAPLGD